MVDFINEVEDELRKDQYNKLLRKWGPLIAALAIAIVAAAGFYEYTKTAEDRAARNASIEYITATDALEAGNAEDALRRFEAISQKAKPGYAGLSLTQAADIELNRGNAQRAVALLDSAAGAFETPLHKELTQYKAALLLSDMGRNDEVLQRVNPLIGSGKPFSQLARELRAFTYLALNDTARARSDFLFLSTALNAGDGVTTRAKQMLALTPSLSAGDMPDVTPIPAIDPTIAAPTDDDAAPQGSEQ